ncbi:MAG TPA: hypothetical protein VMN03_05630 [Burkholderiales bacterium]|nr:hypothetical protein [Burkholderiales bacterium]
MLRLGRMVVWIVVGAWIAALAYSTLSARVLYGDGAWYVLVHLLNPHRFNDYDFQRSFASIISQAPILLGQRLGVDRVPAYATLYSLGIFIFPAIASMFAAFLARRQPLLFGANVLAIVVYGFGANLINTEANLLFGFAWLSLTILALDRPAPFLRGILLPILAFAMLRMYEGMLLVGPILALWAMIAAGRAGNDRERLGLALAGFIFFAGAVVGLGGFLSPRDPSNASGFLSSAFAYLRNPQLFLLLSGMLGLAALAVANAPFRWALVTASVACGLAFVGAMDRLEGYYGLDIYYYNRSFLVLSLPVFAAVLLAVWVVRPRWLGAGSQERYAVMLVPVLFAVAGDVLATHRWSSYVHQFCLVLERDTQPLERLELLKRSGSTTAWSWTHPTMSLLLREQGSTAMVVNEPGKSSWQPFEPAAAPSIRNRGLCESRFLGSTRASFAVPINFAKGKHPSYVAGVSGLSGPEGWATWSQGPTVEVRFEDELPESFDLTVRVAAAFGANKNKEVRVRAGAAERRFVVDSEPFETTLTFREVGDATAITFTIPEPQSPKEIGLSADPRKLGLAFVWMRVTPR